MDQVSDFRADAGAPGAAATTVRIWDAPVRVFHWLMVASFAGAWLTAESENWRLVHVTLGYTMVGLVGFRIVWGLIGTRHARFSSFVRGPAAVGRYLRSLWQGRPEHHAGHNPAGALAIVALLGLTLAVGATGWAVYEKVGGEMFGEVHEVVADILIAVVGIHLAGVVVGSWLHRENLIGAMFSGRKPGLASERIGRPWSTVAALILASVLGFWWLQWQSAPVAGTNTPTAAAKDHGRDDD